MEIPDLSGVWNSRYTYFSSSRQAEFAGEHKIKLIQRDEELLGTSLPNRDGSVIDFRLDIDPPEVIGRWWEKTSPSGHYQGKLFKGAVEFLIKEAGHRLEGIWTGASSDQERLNSGEWILERE